MIESKIYVQISNFVDTNHSEQKYTHMLYLLTGRGQWAVWPPASFSPIYCLHVLHCTYYSSHAYGLFRGFQLYIWPQTPFAGQNYTSNNLSSIFAWIAGSKYQVFDPHATTMPTPRKVARARGFDR